MKASSLRVNRKGEGRVEFRGDPPPETERVDERENLPAELEPGVTYRDVEIRWGAAAWLRDER